MIWTLHPDHMAPYPQFDVYTQVGMASSVIGRLNAESIAMPNSEQIKVTLTLRKDLYGIVGDIKLENTGNVILTEVQVTNAILSPVWPCSSR